MEPQEPRLINVLGMLCGEIQQQRQLQGRAGLSRSPQGAPTALWQCHPAGTKPQQGPAGSGSISKPSFLPWIYFHTCLERVVPELKEQTGWISARLMDEGSATLYKIISISILFMFLTKATAYNNIWPWKLNCFQPRSLWERWWLHSSPVSCVEKPSPKNSQAILSFSFPFNHSKTLSHSFF